MRGNTLNNTEISLRDTIHRAPTIPWNHEKSFQPLRHVRINENKPTVLNIFTDLLSA